MSETCALIIFGCVVLFLTLTMFALGNLESRLRNYNEEEEIGPYDEWFYDFLKRIHNGTLNENSAYEKYFLTQTPYEQAKMIVDAFIEVVNDHKIYELPEDSYSMIKENLSVVAKAIRSDELSPRRKIYFRECLKKGEKAFSKVSVLIL